MNSFNNDDSDYDSSDAGSGSEHDSSLDPYAKLRSLLEEQETFPTRYLHKFIGKNTPNFATDVTQFEAQFPKAHLQTARMSQGDGHVAMTYVLEADTVEDIIDLLKATKLIRDLKFVL